jgi:EAL domain-containing protein (putative c-di-GMP-specific phosphodiesterase class I)
MYDLKKLGIKISIDDFGTGYSSLSYLQMLPFDIIKIDKSFIQSMANDNNQKSIVPIIIMLAKSLGLQVVAEGVESEQQLFHLAKLKCTHIQGYLLGNPAPCETATELETLQPEAIFSHAAELFRTFPAPPL